MNVEEIKKDLDDLEAAVESLIMQFSLKHKGGCLFIDKQDKKMFNGKYITLLKFSYTI